MDIKGRMISALRAIGGSSAPVDPYAHFSCLWRGHSRHALGRLRAESRNPVQDPWVRAECAWILAQYHSAHGEFARAAGAVRMAVRLCPEIAGQKRLRIGAPYIFSSAGQEQAAHRFIKQHWTQSEADGRHDHDELMLLASLAGASQEERLVLINTVFERAGLSPVAMTCPSSEHLAQMAS